jgi:glycosyltransferase involved in cell wall biosynthesis
MRLKRILITGPFASEYSIAKVNRNLAKYMQANAPEGYEVKLYANSEFVDVLPNEASLKRYPFLKDLIVKDNLDSDIILFYNFPKSIYAPYGLNKLKGQVKIAYLGWEESVYPDRLVKECNKQLHAIAPISEHVRQVLRSSGIGLPMRVIHHGLDIPLTKPEQYKIKSKKTFRIYHNSSGQYRKGLDVLVRSYLETFTANDDVVLIIKLFPNLSQDKEALKLIKENRGPEIELINDGNISDGQMRYLAESAQMHVYPARAEGFALPIAEGLALGKAVIATNYSGQADFLTSQNSFPLDYKLIPSKSHLNIPGSKVAEPDQKQLSKLMRYVYENYNSPEVKSRCDNAALVKEQLTWENAAKSMWEYIGTIKNITALKQQKLSVVSTYNSQCGIAMYSSDLYPKITNSFRDMEIIANSDVTERLHPDNEKIKRLWQYSELTFTRLKNHFEEYDPDIIHFQYNLSFYSPRRLAELIDIYTNKGKKVVITLHSVHSSLADIKQQLNRAFKLIVHSLKDKKELENMGITNAVELKHGLPYFPDMDLDSIQLKLGLKGRRIIATHGMIHDKKGFVELIKALAIIKKAIPNILLLCITAINPNNSTSRHTFKLMQEAIAKNDLGNNILLFSAFLETPVVIRLMQAAELIILPYAQVKEGASGAVKYALASRRPVILTESYIFSGLDTGLKLANNEPEVLAAGITKVLEDDKLRFQMQLKARAYFAKYNWEDVSIEHLLQYIS